MSLLIRHMLLMVNILFFEFIEFIEFFEFIECYIDYCLPFALSVIDTITVMSDYNIDTLRFLTDEVFVNMCAFGVLTVLAV